MYDSARMSGLLKNGIVFQFHDNFFFPVGFTLPFPVILVLQMWL
jgi:hypothetical protein